jgi:hypothetical protein
MPLPIVRDAVNLVRLPRLRQELSSDFNGVESGWDEEACITPASAYIYLDQT